MPPLHLVRSLIYTGIVSEKVSMDIELNYVR